jgi:iron complex transport system substrate-binding protein
VFVLDPHTVEGVFESILTVGRLTNRSVAADSLVRALRTRIGVVTEKVGHILPDRRTSVFVGNPDNPSHWTPGPGSFTADIIALAGGRNIADDLDPGKWGVYSLEQIVAKNPEVILTLSDTGDQETIRRKVLEVAKGMPGWRDLRAIRSQRVCVLPGAWVARPGPRVVQGVEQLARYLYPELFTDK